MLRADGAMLLAEHCVMRATCECSRHVATHTLFLQDYCRPNIPACNVAAQGRSNLVPRSKVAPAAGAQVRDGVVAMLEAWARVTPAERLLPSLADYLASPKAGGEGKARARRRRGPASALVPRGAQETRCPAHRASD